MQAHMFYDGTYILMHIYIWTYVYIYIHTSMTYIYICEFVCTCPMVLDTILYSDIITISWKSPQQAVVRWSPSLSFSYAMIWYHMIVFSSDVPTKKIDTHIYIYIYIYIYISTYICIYIYIYICMCHKVFPMFSNVSIHIVQKKSIQKPTEDASWLDAPSYGGILRAPRWDVTGHSLYSSYT